jgi:hypothetical protein
MTSATRDDQLWISRVIQTIRKLERDNKHAVLLTELEQEDRERLERACRVAAWLREVRPGLVLFVASYVVLHV